MLANAKEQGLGAAIARLVLGWRTRHRDMARGQKRKVLKVTRDLEKALAGVAMPRIIRRGGGKEGGEIVNGEEKVTRPPYLPPMTAGQRDIWRNLTVTDSNLRHYLFYTAHNSPVDMRAIKLRSGVQVGIVRGVEMSRDKGDSLPLR